MDYDILLDLVANFGYNLAMSGAETFRVEDSINRILCAYGIESDVFAITNCMIISIRTADGESKTRMRRIGHHGNDLDSVEKFNSLSRKICSEKPDPAVAIQWLKDTCNTKIRYKLPAYLLGHFLGAAGFSVFFGGTLIDAFCSGVCGTLIGLTDRFLDKLRTNQFFRTIASAFIMAFIAYLSGIAQIADNADTVIIGALMLLVPGLIFTNAMRDIIFGDTNSGINRIVQVLLFAAAIALGAGVAWNLCNNLWGIPAAVMPRMYAYLIECVAAFVGCFGFCFLFNIHGPGMLVCALGGTISWGTFCLVAHFRANELVCYFFATLVAASYSEIMARIRKYPAISYLVISILPLIPGAGIYYATNYLATGEMSSFAEKATQTVATAGVIAVGILMISTIVRLWSEWKQNRI